MSSTDLSDAQFLAAFLDCSMAPAEFNHRGHARIAWLLLRRHPMEEAIERTCSGLARLATHLGAADKFHWTLSEALVRLMASSGATDPAVSFEQFVFSNPALMKDASGVLARHYSPERLAAVQARQRFVPPDRLPLPAYGP